MSDIEEIGFINSRNATTRHGTVISGGVIAIESKRWRVISEETRAGTDSARRPCLLLAGFLFALGLAACATSSGGGQESTYGGANYLPREELEEKLGPSVSLFQAVQRLRPRWLRGRRGVSGSGQRFQPRVYFDDTPYGPVGALTRLRVADAEEVRFLNARDATTRYGTGVPGGVIAVTPRKR